MELQDFANGDTNYVSKLNSNNDVLESTVNGLSTVMSGAAASTLSLTAIEQALFGTTIALIGATSYSQSTASTTLTLQPGYAWVPGLSAVVSKSTTTAINFSGQAAATYYITLNISGVPILSTGSTNAIYSVVWTGSAFGTITRLAIVLPMSSVETTAALTSTALGATYTSLDARLEAGEALTAGGGPAWTTLKTNTSKSVAGSSNVTLTATESQARLITLTGALTGSISVTLNTSGPRDWVVYNNTTGAYSVTLKGSSGTGTVIPQGGVSAVVWDGTNLKNTTGDYGIVDVPWASNITLNPSLYQVIRITLAGNTTFTFSGGVDGAKCILELTQDGTGGWAATWPANARGSTSTPLPFLTATPGALDRVGFIYHGPSGKYDCTAAVLGY